MVSLARRARGARYLHRAGRRIHVGDDGQPGVVEGEARSVSDVARRHDLDGPRGARAAGEPKVALGLVAEGDGGKAVGADRDGGRSRAVVPARDGLEHPCGTVPGRQPDAIAGDGDDGPLEGVERERVLREVAARDVLDQPLRPA